MSAKILVLDIETFPNLAFVWGLWDQNVGLNQLVESGSVACFAAKWVGEKKIHFHSEHSSGREAMLSAAWDLVNEADVIVHFNGTSFDMKWLRSEWVREGMLPPSPYSEIDLCTVAKRNFKFPSNKLDYLATELLGEGKVKHSGFDLWVGCMAGDEKSWKQMEKYNRADVDLTERLLERLRPWVKNLPNPALYGAAQDGEHTCPQCGSADVKQQGLSYTALGAYQRYRCTPCGRWSRGSKRFATVGLR